MAAGLIQPPPAARQQPVVRPLPRHEHEVGVETREQEEAGGHDSGEQQEGADDEVVAPQRAVERGGGAGAGRVVLQPDRERHHAHGQVHHCERGGARGGGA